LERKEGGRKVGASQKYKIFFRKNFFPYLNLKEVESRLPQSQVQNYIHMLFKMLSDKQGNVSSAAAQLLTNILSYRANLLQKEVF